MQSPLAFLALSAAASGSILFAGGGWAALDRGSQCEAATRVPAQLAHGRPPALARVAFTPDHRRWGQWSVRLGRAARAGSTVMLSIGPQRFLLASSGEWAWSRGALQEQALVAAARGGGTMRVESRDGAGRRTVDRFLLDGAATAIDAAAARCAGKIARD